MICAQYDETVKELESWEDVEREMIKFADKHGLTELAYVNFQLNGEFNIKKVVGLSTDLSALFG